jgi:hypothetical protein
MARKTKKNCRYKRKQRGRGPSDWLRNNFFTRTDVTKADNRNNVDENMDIDYYRFSFSDSTLKQIKPEDFDDKYLFLKAIVDKIESLNKMAKIDTNVLLRKFKQFAQAGEINISSRNNSLLMKKLAEDEILLFTKNIADDKKMLNDIVTNNYLFEGSPALHDFYTVANKLFFDLTELKYAKAFVELYNNSSHLDDLNNLLDKKILDKKRLQNQFGGRKTRKTRKTKRKI